MSVNIGSTYLDLVKAVSEMADSDPDCPTLVGADQIKGIYLTGENRTIVGAESDVGIIWEGDGALFKDENAITEITNTHFMTRVPIVAGNNVTFETDTDNQVVKINATGGGTSGVTPTKIGDDENYVEVTLSNGDIAAQGTTIHFLGSEYQEFVTGDNDQTSIVLTPEVLAINSPNTHIYGLGLLSTADGDLGSEGQVLMSNGESVYWGDVSGTGESSIIDLGRQESHKAAQQAMVDYVSSQSATHDCYLFKYWCSCYGNACFAVVFKFKNDTNINISGTVYDSMRGFREFVYIDGKFTTDGCWKNLASFDEEFEGLPTEDKSVLGAINEIYQKVPTKIEGDDAHVEIDSGDVGINANYIYVGGNAEGGDAVFIEAVNDGNIDIHSHEGDLTLRSYGKLVIEPKGRCGTAGQVLMSDGQSAYWGDVEGSSGGGSPMTPITYAELKALRDSGKLVAGMFYRITDYVCTTVQAETRAMNNRFDIIVQALSNNTLSETAKADYNAEDNYFKTESGGNALVEGSVTKYYDIYEDCDDVEDKTENYKSNDTFVEYGYLENNEGVTVPVLYKNDLDSYADEGADYGDTFYYIGTYEYEGTTYDRWRKIEASGYGWDSTGNIYALTNVIVENNEIISSVKAGGIKYNANLPAWELKYSLDNDTTRFAWAMEGQAIVNMKSTYSNGNPLVRQPAYDNSYPVAVERGYIYAWGTQADVDDDDPNSFVYSTNETLTNGEIVWNGHYGTPQSAEVVEGKGVIYYMKDEHGNECPYDFKNIQFKRSTEWQEEHIPFIEDSLSLSVGDVEWFYTFSWVNEDLSVDDLTMRQDLTDDEGGKSGIWSNVINEYVKEGIRKLNNNLLINTYNYDGGNFYSCYNNTFGNDCSSNTFGNSCSSNTFGNDCSSNTFGNDCYGNTFGNNCYNTFGNDCSSNTFGNDCYRNTFGNSCYNNTFGNGCYGNTFGNEFNYNTFGDSCTYNTFGNGCYNNTFGNNCYGNKMQVDNSQYVYVLSGVQGKTLTPVANVQYVQIFKPAGTVETEV